MVLSTSPAISYSRSQVAGGEDPFGLPRLDPYLQLQPTLQIRQKTQDSNISPRKHNHRNQSRLFYFKKKHKGSNTLVFSVLQGRSFFLKSSSRVEWAIWWVNSAKYSSSSLSVSVKPTMTNLFCFDFHQPESEGREMQRREGKGREGRGGGAAHQPESEMREMQRREGRGGGRVKWEWNERDAEGGRLNVILGLEKIVFILAFFFKCWLVEPVRFGSIQSVSDFRNQKRTEPEFFCDFLIG